MDPFRVIAARDGVVTIDGRGVDGDPWAVLRAELDRHRQAPVPGLPPFQGGAIGYLGYELARHLEDVPAPPADPDDFPDMELMLCDLVVAIDHGARRAVIISSGLPETEPAARRARAAARLGHAARRMAAAAPLAPPATPSAPPRIACDVSREAYETAVRRVIDYILAGDVFQANISQRFVAELPAGLGPLDLFRRLRGQPRALLRAPLASATSRIVSTSPERFLRRDGDRWRPAPSRAPGRAAPRPPRTTRSAAELAASEKDRAENVMIVDLLRNDLSRVCATGSVRGARALRARALRHGAPPGLDRHGAAAAGPRAGRPAARRASPAARSPGRRRSGRWRSSPSSSRPRRGLYCGAIGYLGFDGALDTSIVIRTFAIRGRRVDLPGRRRRGGRLGAGRRVRGDPRQGPRARGRALAVIVVVDNYDSFVHNLARYVRELGWETQVVRCDAVSVDEIAAMEPSHIVLSPGPCTPNEAGVCVPLVRRLGPAIPVLGVCLGHQCIGQAFGGQIVRARRPMHGKASRIRHGGAGVFAGLPDPLSATRYHSLVVGGARPARGARDHRVERGGGDHGACATASIRSSACSSTRSRCSPSTATPCYAASSARRPDRRSQTAHDVSLSHRE